MAAVNAHLAAMYESYLFSEVDRRVQAYRAENPQKRLLRLGIGDVSRPLAPAVVDALVGAAEEMGQAQSFRGYGPTRGYPFLLQAIIEREYEPVGVKLSQEDVFVSDGAKTDMAALQELFAPDAVAAVCDPVYPVYTDANRMAGRKIVLLPCSQEDGFCPPLPRERVDFLYLCSPNNPTGAALTYAQAARFVDYALENGVALLFDAAYSAYISESGRPKSIFEIQGAKEVAVETGSFSKSAGFTGLRCAWTVVPRENRFGLNALWARRAAAKMNGVSYPVQRAAQAALETPGWEQSRENVRYYMENAKILLGAAEKAGFRTWGGKDAPYLWVKCPDGMSGWEWFDVLLQNKGMICTPGEGFGSCGKGFVRFSAFASREETQEAAARLSEG